MGAKRILLHIGAEKTGTSTLQMLLAVNRDLLRARGICYPLLPGTVSHVGLSVFALEPKRGKNLHAKMKLWDRAAVDQYREHFLERLQREVDESECDTIIFSNEHLSSRTNRPENALRVAEGLRTIAKDISVFIYLRPQYELVLSAYSTAVKSGRTMPIDLGKTEKNHSYNYDRMLSYWESAVGLENITVRRFIKQRFVGGSLITDFFAMLGIELPADIVIPPNRNTSLDAETVEYLRFANRSLPRRGTDGRNPDRNGLILALEKISNGPRITAPAFELAAIDEAFANVNSRVNERYFPGAGEPLFPPFAGAGAGDIMALGAERAVEIGVALWCASRAAKTARAATGLPRGKRRGRRKPDAAEELLSEEPMFDEVDEDAEGDEE